MEHQCAVNRRMTKMVTGERSEIFRRVRSELGSPKNSFKLFLGG